MNIIKDSQLFYVMLKTDAFQRFEQYVQILFTKNLLLAR